MRCSQDIVRVLIRLTTTTTTTTIIIIISILPYLTDEGEHTALYKINEKVYIKPEKY